MQKSAKKYAKFIIRANDVELLLRAFIAQFKQQHLNFSLLFNNFCFLTQPGALNL